MNWVQKTARILTIVFIGGAFQAINTRLLQIGGSDDRNAAVSVAGDDGLLKIGRSEDRGSLVSVASDDGLVNVGRRRNWAYNRGWNDALKSNEYGTTLPSQSSNRTRNLYDEGWKDGIAHQKNNAKTDNTDEESISAKHYNQIR